MKRKLVAVLVIILYAALSGCASNLMRDSSAQLNTPENSNTAKIVFMRTSMVAGAIGCDLFEVVDGDLKFIGQLPTGNKIVYETTPGKKVFMAYGTAADFMLAEVSAGKTYYSIVRPNWGTGGFAPTPIRSNSNATPNVKSPDFHSWLSGTKPIEPTENAPAWFSENKAKFQEIYAEYWRRFQRKNEQEKSERTLMPNDGQ